MMTRTVLLLAVASAVASAQQSTATSSAPEIVNTGSGEVRVKPDRAEVTIAVVTRGSSAAIAGRQNAERIRPVLAALRRQGLPDSALSTSGYSIDTEEIDERAAVRPKARTYVARNAVRVSLKRLEDLGRTIDTALAAGATEIADVTFAASDTKAARQQAIALAVQAARSDAEATATAAGGRLGPIIEVQLDPAEGGSLYRRMRLEEVVVSGFADTPMLPTELTVRVSVRIRFALLRAP